MRPDKQTCKNCGKEIEGKKTYCDDACRMAFKRNPNKQPEQNNNPNTNKAEQIEPEQSNPNNDMDFRSSLTETDKTFYDRAMKDFGEPYYYFGNNTHQEKCIRCSKSFKTTLNALRFCSYQHYTEELTTSN